MHGERVTAPATTAPSRAALLTVDDDPGVSRAVARDLRRHYGETHRIVRAESGEQALDALREMKLRGEQVAVLLADYRMPQMSGIEFLEQAMDLYPAANASCSPRTRTPTRPSTRSTSSTSTTTCSSRGIRPRRSSTRSSTRCSRYGTAPTTVRCRRPRSSVTGGRPDRRGAGVPGPQPGALPLVRCPTSRRAQALLAAAGADDHTLPVVITADGRSAGRADRRRAGRAGRA